MLMLSSSSLIFFAQPAASLEGRKSSHGFARLSTEMLISCNLMKERMCDTEEYSGPIGRPSLDGEIDGLAEGASEGRIMRRGCGAGTLGEVLGSSRS